jgi:hypothetical protein
MRTLNGFDARPGLTDRQAGATLRWIDRRGVLVGRPPRPHDDGRVTVGRRAWDVDAAGWPEGEIELRAGANARYLGRFMLTPEPGPAPPLQARLVAATLTDQTGGALDTSDRPPEPSAAHSGQRLRTQGERSPCPRAGRGPASGRSEQRPTVGALVQEEPTRTFSMRSRGSTATRVTVLIPESERQRNPRRPA